MMDFLRHCPEDAWKEILTGEEIVEIDNEVEDESDEELVKKEVAFKQELKV